MIKGVKVLGAHRFYWNVGNAGDGKGYSNKISTKLLFDARAWMLGLRFVGEPDHWFLYIAPLPTLMIRLHWARSWGGRYK